MKFLFPFFVLFTVSCVTAQVKKSSLPEKTSFQEAAPWKAAYDIRSDIAMVYGINESFEERVKSYRDRGYNVQFMTGIAWGDYQDYFLGRWDGTNHMDEGQVQRNGDGIGHGKDIPYIVPTANFITYFKTLMKRVIDAGITSIYLEEPEFWARGGYSPAFKKEWKQYYGFDWIPPHSSPEATYLSSKLKYHLYFTALKEVFAYTKSYGEQKGIDVKCYVPTHTLLNYSSWHIVSPEASLAALPGMSGYIAQVWTGTAREPNFYKGIRKERVFETAFLEYGSMLSMTEPTGRRMYFLTDPIEDRGRTWDDYKRNYQATFTAELMYPKVDHFEVMPWPRRIYQGKFKLENNNTPQSMPPAYATQVQVMINTLNFMPASSNSVNGSKGIGVLVGNSMMFQRFPTHDGYEDPQLSNFYGMVLPLLKKGIPVETVHMENLGFPKSLQDIKVLIMSYANMKPLSIDVHQHLADWVKKGGVLLFYGRDDDPFQQVKEWWNSNDKKYGAPSQHLFQQMQITPEEGKIQYRFGKGKVYIVRHDPKELAMDVQNDAAFTALVKRAYEQDAKAGPFITKNHFFVQRGPYHIASVMDEFENNEPLQIKGNYIDLFDPALPVLSEKTVRPGEQSFLYDINTVKNKKQPHVLAAASRVYEEKTAKRQYTFVTKSPSNTNNAMRILLPAKPVTVKVTKANTAEEIAFKNNWDEKSKTCLLEFENDADGIRVVINW